MYPILTPAPAPNFSPNDIPVLIFGFDASNPKNDGTLYPDGTSMSIWNDISGAGLNATQASGLNQPVFKTNIQNGLSGILFDHNSDQFFDTAAVDLTADCTFFFVGKSTSNNTYSILDIAIVTLPEFNLNSGSNQMGGGNYDGTVNRGFAWQTAATNVTHLLCQRYDSTVTQQQIVYVDGVATSPVSNAGVSAAGSIPRRIGEHPSANVPFAGYMFELLMYRGALSSTNITLITNYLNQKWRVF